MSVKILIGDVREQLATLPDESVHCCVTSPPYFGLRSYLPDGHEDKHLEIGLELSPDAYIDTMVAVFREVRRVLRNDGVLFLNIGDSYAGSWGAQSRRITESDEPSWHSSQIKNHPKRASNTGTIRTAGVKPKDLYGIPWMLAFALRADGWWLRQDIIWQKLNPMPESVTDRCTKAHEYLFLLSKAEKYYYDAEAIKEDSIADAARPRTAGNKSHKYVEAYEASDTEEHRTKAGLLAVADVPWLSRNKRSVWTVATAPYSEAHFATFPPALIEPCILAGTSAYGVCATCGAPWVRVTDEPVPTGGRGSGNKERKVASEGERSRTNTHLGSSVPWAPSTVATVSWRASCSCGTAEAVPATVLDPFGGSGTTALVAEKLGRDCILIELNPDYAKMAERRCRSPGLALA